MGGKSSTSTTKTELPPEIMKAYEGLISQATPISQTPYQPYTGGVGGSGFEQNQITGFNNIANLAGSSNGAFNSASNALASTATPTSASVSQYMSPYLDDVVKATTANMNEQNAEQQQGVLGNAAAQGALGGNRVGVAQAELARQQNLANQQTISGLYNQGYNTALSAAQADKAAQLQAASGYANLGQTAMQTNLSQAAAQVGAGTQQQQWNYSQYQNALSYPFETTSWLANIVEGLGAGSGGTTTSTQPSGNTGSAVLGGILSLASLFNRGGVVGGEERPHRAQGGIIPYSGPSGIAANNNNPSGANDNFATSYVPQVATAGIAPGRSTLPQAPQGGQQQDQGQQMLQQGIKAAEQNLKEKYPNGIVAGLSQPSPAAAATVTPYPTPDANPGVLSQIGSFLGFAEGGVARRGYEGGGYVDPYVVTNSVAPDQPTFDPSTVSPTQMKAFLDRAAPASPQGVVSGGPGGVVPIVPDDVAAANTAGGGIYTPAPALPPPVTVKDQPIAGVVPQTSPSRVNLPINSASQGIYDTFMNTVRGSITNPYGLAAVAATGSAESGFSPSNTYRAWSDPDQSGGGGTAGGIMSWRNDRLNAMRKFVANNGGDPSHPDPALQAQFFLQEDPSLVNALNQAKSPAEAQQLMNNAWKFAGYNRPGGEAGRRIAMANQIAPQFEATADNNGVAGNGSGNAVLEPSGSAGVDRAAVTGSTSPSGTPANGVMPATDKGVSFSNENASPGILGRLFGGHGIGLSDDQRMALLSAGLGMMAGTSPNFATNVGKGGLKGVEAWRANQALNRENAQAQSEIATRSGQLGLEGQRVDLAGKQLALDAKKAASEIGLQTAQTGKVNLETQTGRYQQTVTPAGIIVRGMTDPNAPPKLTTWDDIQKNGPPVVSNEAVGANVASGSGAAASPAAPSAAQATPKAQGENAPITAAPTTPVGAPAQAQPVFQSSAPSRIPIDGRNFSPTGQQIVANETTDALKTAREEYQGSTNAQTQLAEMRHDLATIPNSAWTTPGTGFSSRVQWAKAINTAFQGLGVEAPIDEKAVAAGEDLNKLTTRLGFDLSKTLGSREAASIVDQSVSAVPGGANSAEGARRVIAGIEASNQRKIDYYRFLQDWSAKTGGSIKGADDYFNKVNPPELYALTTYVPQAAMAALRQHPETAKDFDDYYGMGHNVSQYVLAGVKQ